MRKLAVSWAALLLLASLGSTPALADFNFGASFTDTRIQDEDFDTDDNGYKVFAGWRLLRLFGVEAQYVDFGDFHDTVDGMNVNADASSLDVFLVGSIRFWRADLFGKAGRSFWKVDSDAGDDDGSDFVYGFGGALRVTNRLWVRGEYEVYDFDQADVEMASLGLDIRFW